MSDNGLSMIDLVLTHLNQPWGPPWTLATLGDMLENDHFGGNSLKDHFYNISARQNYGIYKNKKIELN